MESKAKPEGPCSSTFNLGPFACPFWLQIVREEGKFAYAAAWCAWRLRARAWAAWAAAAADVSLDTRRTGADVDRSADVCGSGETVALRGCGSDEGQGGGDNVAGVRTGDVCGSESSDDSDDSDVW